MGLKVCALGSGSTGNCIYVASDTTAILIDVGIPSTRVEKCLKVLGCPSVPHILVTHEHHDHISDVATFSRRNGSPIYCHTKTRNKLSRKTGQSSLIEFDDGDFFVGDITVSPFPVSHDVPCVGYGLFHKGRKITVMTDLGCVGNRIADNAMDSDVVLLECNHDERLLKVNRKYPEYLKRRILSDSGHLSNNACASTAVKLAKGRASRFILAHLSLENNYPELAFNTVKDALEQAGFAIGPDVGIEVARHDRMSGMYEVL